MAKPWRHFRKLDEWFPPSAGILEIRQASWDDLNPADCQRKPPSSFVFSLFSPHSLLYFIIFIDIFMSLYIILIYFFFFSSLSSPREPGPVHYEISHSALFISRLTPTRKLQWPMRMATIHRSHCSSPVPLPEFLPLHSLRQLTSSKLDSR